MIDGAILSGLQDLLANGDESARWRALDHLPPLADPGALALVARLLGDPSGAVCEAAVNVLARSSAPATVISLAIAHLEADQPSERGYASTVLVRRGADALPAMIDMLHDSDAHKRKYAVDVLAQIGDPAAALALVAALDDENVNVAATAAEALGQLHAVTATSALSATLTKEADWLRIAALGALAQIGGSQALAAACRASSTNVGIVLAAAVAAVGRTGPVHPQRALSVLARSLVRDGGQPLRGVIVIAMADILRDCSAWPSLQSDSRTALIDVLAIGAQSSQPEVRAAATYCLGLAGDLEAVRSALATIDGSAAFLAALRVLALSDSFEPADETICRRLVLDSTDATIQALALRALLAHDVAEAPALTMILCANREFTDDEEALAILCDCPAQHLVPAVSHALGMAQPEIGRAVFRALFPVQQATALNRPSSGKHLLRLAAAHADWRTRAHALSLLGAARAQWARAVLHGACDDAEPRVRVRAVHSLAQCGLLVRDAECISRHLHDTSGWVRVAAIEALVDGAWLADDEAALMSALCDEFPPAALAAARAALALEARGAPAFSPAIATELKRLAATEFVRSDPDVVLWRHGKGGD